MLYILIKSAFKITFKRKPLSYPDYTNVFKQAAWNSLLLKNCLAKIYTLKANDIFFLKEFG